MRSHFIRSRAKDFFGMFLVVGAFLSTISVSEPSHKERAVFQDEFNRSDGDPGNGWEIFGDVGGRPEIRKEKLLLPSRVKGGINAGVLYDLRKDSVLPSRFRVEVDVSLEPDHRDVHSCTLGAALRKSPFPSTECHILFESDGVNNGLNMHMWARYDGKSVDGGAPARLSRNRGRLVLEVSGGRARCLYNATEGKAEATLTRNLPEGFSLRDGMLVVRGSSCVMDNLSLFELPEEKGRADEEACLKDGRLIGQTCWHNPGVSNRDCTTICSAAGGVVDDATREFAGSAGTDANCRQVVRRFFQEAADVPIRSTNDTLGCHTYREPAPDGGRFIRFARGTALTDFNSRGPDLERFCACRRRGIP